MKLPTELRAFVESLNAAKAKYLIVGGYAVAFHGHPRFTGDIDFFIEATPENANRVVSAIDHFGFGSLGLKVDDFTKNDVIVQLGNPPNRIDLITTFDAVEFEEAWASRLSGDVDGIMVDFISKELLLRNKKATNRPKDIGDVRNL